MLMRQRLDREWSRLRHHAFRKYLRNPRSRRLFAQSRPVPSPVQAKVLRDLHEQGVAFVSFADLFGESTTWARLAETVADFVGGPVVSEAVAAWQSGARHAVKRKGYLVRLYPEDPVVHDDDPWLSLGVDDRILGIVNQYFELFSRLFAFDVWYTIADKEERPARGSQKWHRDPEDRHVLKVFLYFSDVDTGCGPLQYVRHSRAGEQYGRTSFTGTGWRGSDADLARVAPDDVVTCTGRIGTFIFCDTAGLHRGGYAVDAPRVLATWAYSTPASLYPRRFRLSGDVPFEGAAARYALTC